MSELFPPNPLQNGLPGFRLQTLQVWNWGTFDSSNGQVHTVHPAGDSTLLIGRNGTGKSTLVDALLTLLTPPQKRNYNVAAGSSGKKRERDERTYIKGAFSHTSTGESHRAQTEFLRPGNSHYSVILGVFAEAGSEQIFTLAQMLYLDAQGKPNRMFCWAEEKCSFEKHFAGITSMERLRGQLEKRGLKVTGTYTDFGRFLRRKTGMGEKAMDIFNQAVAVKEIDSLDEFIREHMLQKQNWRDVVTKVLTHFDLLSDAYAALVRTREEVELLEPVAKAADSYERAKAELETAQVTSDAVAPFFAQVTLDIARPECEKLQREEANLRAKLEEVDGNVRKLDEKRTNLKVAIEGSGGERLRELERIIPQEEKAEAERKVAANHFSQLLSKVGLDRLEEGEQFFEELLGTAMRMRAQPLRALKTATERLNELAIFRHEQDRELEEIQRELTALLKRRTQLPEAFQAIRAELCAAVNLPVNELPFAAELMAVDENELEWEGSIEKVLRNFSLTLLVPEEHYQKMSSLIDRTMLKDHRGRGMRLNYERISKDLGELSAVRVQHEAMVTKLLFKEGHPLADWLRHRVETRFDYRCCESIAVFQGERGRAMTRERHIKHGQNRHEKDDRAHVRDRSSYVLGWDNQRKINYLKTQLEAQKQKIEATKKEQSSVQSDVFGLENRLQALKEIDAVRYAGIDHWSLARQLASLKKERQELIESDDQLKALKASLQATIIALSQANDQRDKVIGDLSKNEAALKSGRALLKKAEKDLAEMASISDAVFQVLRTQIAREITLESLYEDKARLQKWASDHFAQRQETRDKRETEVVSKMSRYLQKITEQQSVMTAEISSLASFLARSKKLLKEDLPRHTERFKKHLNEKVTQEIAILNDKLRQAEKKIEEKIRQLNLSLTAIPAGKNGFMKLELEKSKDREIVDFRSQLRSCLDGSFGSGEVADEDRYGVIAKFIKRIKEEERWRDRVIDVRRWYHFGVGEYDRETELQTSYYTDSAGQSGGEKARLAFTILVAAIAYQYNIDPHASSSSRFHFVMVDEMFSKVDDKYSEYALELFRSFGLQLLIVAPFDAKARITEPYVDHYLHVIKDNDRSQVFSMTAEEALPARDA